MLVTALGWNQTNPCLGKVPFQLVVRTLPLVADCGVSLTWWMLFEQFGLQKMSLVDWSSDKSKSCMVLAKVTNDVAVTRLLNRFH